MGDNDNNQVEDTWVLLGPSDNPDGFSQQLVRIPRERLERILAENPDLASIIRPADQATIDAFADQQDMARRREAFEESPIAGRAAVASINFANELTFGLPAALMDPEERRTFEAGNQVFSGTAIGSSLLGVASTLPIGAGARAGNVGVRGLIPGVLPQAVGNTVERALFRQLAPRVGNRAARAASFAGGATVDGALSGVSDAVTQANIAGTPLDAEAILANGLFGSVLGLGVGGMASLPGALGRRATSQAESLVDNGMAPRAIGRDAEGRIQFQQPENPQQDSAFIRAVMSPPGRALSGATLDDGVTMRMLNVPGAVREAESGMEYTARTHRIAEDGNASINEARQFIDQLRDADIRQANFSSLAGREADAIALRESVESATDQLESLVGSTRTRRVARMGKLADETVDVPGSAGSRLGKEGESARDIVRLAREVEEAASAPEFATRLDNFIARMRQQKTLDKIVDPTLRGHVENLVKVSQDSLEKLDPGAMAAHRAVDAFDKAVQDLRGGALKHNVSFDEERLNPGSIFQSVSDSGFRVTNDLTQPLTQLFRTADEAVGEVATHYGMDVSDLRDRLNQTVLDIGEAHRTGELIARAREMGARSSQGRKLLDMLGLPPALVGTALGGVIGGPLGAATGFAIGAGVGLLSHPLDAIRHLSALSGLKRTTETRLAEEVMGLRKALQNGRRARKINLGARALPRLVMALRSPSERVKEYEAITSQLRDYASNPLSLTEAVGSATEQVADLSPDLASHMAQTTVRGVSYLVSELPPASQPGLWGQLEPMQPSHSEMESFIRRFEAIEDPLSIVSRAADFSLTVDHVAAVRAVYPELYTLMQAEIAGMIGDLSTLPPYSARIQVGTLLDIQSDPSLDSGFIFKMQQRYSQTEQQQQEIGPRQVSQADRSIATNTLSASAGLSARLTH